MSAKEVLDQRSDELLRIDGVVGHATKTTPVGDVIVVYVRDAEAAALVPFELDSVPVETMVTGPIRPLTA